MLAEGREWVFSAHVTHRSYADPATKAASAISCVGDLRGGRLLVYFPDAELADGAAEAESRGFFDAFNAPPWDCWVALLRDDRGEDSSYSVYVLSWVPRVLLDLASAGIRVNPAREESGKLTV